MHPNFFLRLLNKINPQLVWNLYAFKCKRLLPSPLLILSFDCDTEEDINVAEEVHGRLLDIGILPVYAVPGELLKKGEKVYKKIHETGAQFINHGGREHTYFDTKNNRHASCFFYDQQPLETLKEDILQGHKILSEVLGVKAQGWRTPHFGTFQNPDQLRFLYSVLNELGYQFSTSTTPQNAYQHGPIYKEQGIIEIPVSGIFTEPFNIMDTWAYFGAPDRTKEPEDYLKACESLAKFSSEHPLLINIYGDPSHIHKQEDFFEGMKYLAKFAKNIDYTRLLGMVDENIRSL